MFLSLFQTALAALTVENLFFPNGLGFSRIQHFTLMLVKRRVRLLNNYLFSLQCSRSVL